MTLLAGLRELDDVATSRRRARLTDFHARFKYTLLAYDEAGMRELGRIAAGAAGRSWEDTVREYRERFIAVFERPATLRGHVNALLHAFGHLSERLTPARRSRFLQDLADVRSGAVSPRSARALLRSWAEPAREPWLAAQTYLDAPGTPTNGGLDGRNGPRRTRRYPRCVPSAARPGRARGGAAD